jgi:hypothetical protein
MATLLRGAAACLVILSLLLAGCERESGCSCEFIVAEPPDGPTTVFVDSTATYSTAATATGGYHTFSYRFDWGDGEISQWTQSDTASHAWSQQGQYLVRAQARDAKDTWLLSPWSESLSVWVVIPSPILPPEALIGPGILCLGQPGTFCAQHYPYRPGVRLDYQFDWGDGALSDWSADSCGTHTWTEWGCYYVRARRRNAIDTSSVSDWSRPRLLSATNGSIELDPPQGPDHLYPGEAGTYCIGVTASLCCGSIEYQIDRDDYDDYIDPWSTNSCASLAWYTPGIYVLSARARCLDNLDVPVSRWSAGTLVTVTDGRAVFRQIEDYFVSDHDLEPAPVRYLVIDNQQLWESVFPHPTPYCEVPTPAEFTQHVVVAVLKFGNSYWEMEMSGVALEAGVLKIRYRAQCIKEDMSWYALCHVAAIVNRVECYAVAFYENGELVATVGYP